MTLQDPGNTFFPYNALEIIQNLLTDIDGDMTFVQRRILNGDPDQTIGVAPVDWSPLGSEIGRTGPTLQRYTIYVQSLIVDPDSERGLRMHSYLAKRVREMLARLTTLQVGLRQLNVVDEYGVGEKTVDVHMGNQVFHTQEFDGNWNWLSTAELLLDTQIYRQ